MTAPAPGSARTPRSPDTPAPGAGDGPPTSPGDSLAPAPADVDTANWRRRLAQLSLFRLVVISLVLGSSLFLAWLSDADMSTSSARLLLAIIITTYALTIAYALLIRHTRHLRRLAQAQLCIDLAIATLLVHITGGAGSAYTFFYPLAIIGAATLQMRSGTLLTAAAAVLLFSGVSLAGASGVLPAPPGDPMFPGPPGGLDLARALGLNVAAFIAVAILATSLGNQLQRASAVIQSERSATADLRTLHADIIRSLSSGLVTVDRDGTVLTCNATAGDILGLDPDRAPGHPVDRLMPGLGALIASIGARERLRRGELEIPRDGGADLALGVTVSPLFDRLERVVGRVVNFQDLTELRRVQARYEQARRLAVVGSLAAGIAHEIRNPLASISGSLELLRTSEGSDPETQTLTDIVTREVERLNDLVTDLLDYTNPEPRELAEIQLGALAVETLRLFRRDKSLPPASVEMRDDASCEGPRVVGDAGKLQQILWNLLRNAVQAAASGGGHVTLYVGAEDDEAVIAVEDDGPGIAEEHIDRIFDPFFTTKSRGSGLGLATVQSVVNACGGHIRADNRDTRGCAVVIRLPLREPDDHAAQGAGENAPA